VRFDGNARDAAILHTFLALASASVDCAENSDVPLRACRTKSACRLAVQLLVGIAQTAHDTALLCTAPHRTAPHRIASHRIASQRPVPVAANAAKLPVLGLEEACAGMLHHHLLRAPLVWNGEPNSG
jgi:hypothetical protein